MKILQFGHDASGRRRLTRLGAGLVTQLGGQAVEIAIQLVGMPILLAKWGVDQYGLWLMVSTLPVYLTMADIGYTQVAANEMAMAFAAGDRARTLTVFHSLAAFLAVVFSAVVGVGVILLLTLPDWMFLASSATPDVLRTTLIVFLVSVPVGQAHGLVSNAFRATGRFPEAVGWNTTTRLLEGSSLIGVVLAGGGFIPASLTALLPRLVITMIAAARLRALEPWLRIGVSGAKRLEISRLAGPSFAYVLVSVSSALQVQTPIVLLGAMSSPAAAAIFGASRTISRVGLSFAIMLNNLVAPEYAAFIGRGEIRSFSRFLRLHLALMASFAILYLGFFGIFADLLFRLLTRGAFEIDHLLFYLLICSAAIEMSWNSLLTPAVATSQHTAMAYSIFVISLLSLAPMVVAIHYFAARGAAATGLAVNVIVIGLVAHALARVVGRFKHAANATDKPPGF